MATRLLYIFLLLPHCIFAQYLFTNLKPGDGLSSRETKCTYTDNEGYVWIGTENGLNRYDGSHFKVFNTNNGNYPATIGTAIYALTEPRRNEIWIGTNAGAAAFNKITSKFNAIRIASGKPTPPSVNSFITDRTGKLWIGTSNGLYFYNKGVFHPVSTIIKTARLLDSVACGHSNLAYDSRRNYLWIGDSRGLYCLDLNNEQVYSAMNNPYGWPIFDNCFIHSIAVNEEGNLAYSTGSKKGLCFYNFLTGKLSVTPYINSNPLWKMEDGCNSLAYDRENRLWISTWLYTAFVQHPDGRFEHIPYNREMPYSIGYGFFNEARPDRYGNIWFATINGVSKLPGSNYVENIIKSPTYPYFFTIDFANINAVSIDDAGNYWLGKMDGLVKYDCTTREFSHFNPTTNSRWNELYDLKWVSNMLWCATSNGMKIFDPARKTFRPVVDPVSKMPLEGSASWIHVDQFGNIWFSIWLKGLYRFNPATNKLNHFTSSDQSWGELKSTKCISFSEAANGDMWIGTADEGLVIFHAEKQRFQKTLDVSLSTSSIFSMTRKNEFTWISTTKKLAMCDKNGKVVKTLTPGNGIPPFRLHHLNIDSLDRLWAISREGLFCTDLNTNQTSQVNIKATFSFNDHWNTLVQKDNLLYAAMLDHLVVINTQKYPQQNQPTPPLISGFRIYQQEYSFNREQTIELEYSQNYFSFEFSSPLHNESPSLEYSYKLENFDKKWNFCGRSQTASYTNVSAGHYIFKVRSTMGSSATERETTIHVIVKPPFYQTAWFIIICVMLLGCLAWWLLSRRKIFKMKKKVNNTIDYFANSVYGENSVNEICWDIARNCISQLDFEDCVVYLMEEDGEFLVQKAAFGPKNPKGHEIMNPIRIKVGQGIVGTVAATGKPLLIGDTTQDPRYIVDDESRCSELAVPIFHDHKVIGVIDSEHSKKYFFNPSHLKALTTIASISANKIAEAQAEASVKENEIKLLEINKMLAESQLMALRAQMNPHFVFNCLNSIQECIVTEKYGEASKYLNKFSKLFRMVLNNSGRDLVTIDEEVDVLTLYLELEQMRFQQSFHYEIIIDDDMESDILIPSMLLQPYVENALWHGLMHKNGERILTISFNRKSEDVFECIIDDNGIGRDESFRLKQQQSKAKRHESKGLRIAKDRLDIIKRQNNHASLEIIDKYNTAGGPEGTTIRIELSAFLKN